ncbi:MAG: hypothetical protein V7K98_23370 [Nostoc sp.]|uniref:hypothetical protein n=1 Tax=Nostoc sp. TaxID=1180 RepID=UPI002FFC842A
MIHYQIPRLAIRHRPTFLNDLRSLSPVGQFLIAHLIPYIPPLTWVQVQWGTYDVIVK